MCQSGGLLFLSLPPLVLHPLYLSSYCALCCCLSTTFSSHLFALYTHLDNFLVFTCLLSFLTTPLSSMLRCNAGRLENEETENAFTVTLFPSTFSSKGLVMTVWMAVCGCVVCVSNESDIASYGVSAREHAQQSRALTFITPYPVVRGCKCMCI